MFAGTRSSTLGSTTTCELKAAIFRPAAIAPLHGIRSKTAWVQAAIVVLGPLLALLYKVAPNHVTTTEQVGRAMLKVVRQGYPKPVLEVADINSL